MQVLLSLLVGILGITHLAQQKARDLAALQGTWRVVRAEFDENELAQDDIAGQKIVFRGSRQFIVEHGKKMLIGQIVIRPDRFPKWLDTKVTAGINKGKTAYGIYELNGNKLILCGGAPPRKRPNAFSSKDMTNLLILEKEK